MTDAATSSSRVRTYDPAAAIDFASRGAEVIVQAARATEARDIVDELYRQGCPEPHRSPLGHVVHFPCGGRIVITAARQDGLRGRSADVVFITAWLSSLITTERDKRDVRAEARYATCSSTFPLDMPARSPIVGGTPTRICVNCAGPHTIAACPALAAVAPTTDPLSTRCTACGARINPETAECLGCSD